MAMGGRSSGSRSWLALAGALGGVVAAGLATAILALLLSTVTIGDQCASPAGSGQVVLGPPGSGQLVGATEYGGPGDPSSGTVGASGVNLLEHPDSYAELGGYTFQTATAMGGLPYMTPLRITWGDRSGIAYKRDFGLGGGPIDGLPRVIDLWWEFAGALGIPYEDGQWSGPVRISRPPATGAASLLGQNPAAAPALTAVPTGAVDPAACAPAAATGVPLTPGRQARLLPDGLAAAPAAAPAAVRGMIAAGNQIVGKPYLYGGGHGLPLSEIAPAYDCSRSVGDARVLRGAGARPVGDALRQRRPRVHVCRRPALGHLECRRPGRRELGHRLASPDPQRGRVYSQAPGGAMRVPALGLRRVWAPRLRRVLALRVRRVWAPRLWRVPALRLGVRVPARRLRTVPGPRPRTRVPGPLLAVAGFWVCAGLGSGMLAGCGGPR